MKLPAIGIALGLASAGFGCCGVTTLGRVVEFGGQNNIIIWDPVTKTEHFVRNASFVTKAKDFGFIAPTPTRPELSRASAAAFTLLAELEPVHDYPADSASKSAESPAVKVIEVKDVAGYRATVLKANDAKALSAWMTSNGYHTTTTIREWTDFYIQKGWYLTAFKVLNKEEVAQTGVVRLSFKTDRPFNPYYVPKDNIVDDPEAPLTIFFVAPGVYEAKTEDGKKWSYDAWTVPLPPSDAARLEGYLELKPGQVPPGSVVSSYTDYTFPNATKGDLYFDFKETLPDPVELGPERTTSRVIAPFIGLFFGVVGVCAWLIWRKR